MPLASISTYLQLPAVWANDPHTNIQSANSAIQNAFTAVLSAERAGKDVTALLAELNNAASLIAEAENAYTSGHLADIIPKAESAAQNAQQVKYNAENLIGNSVSSLDSFWVTIAVSSVGSLAFSTGLLLVWRHFKQTFQKRTPKFRNYRIIFIAIGLVGVLLFTSPVLSVLRSPAQESFSIIHLLGPDHMTNTIPSSVQPSTTYSTYLGIENHLGSTANYICLVKLTNDTDTLPNSNLGTPSPLPALYKFNLFLQNGQTWESPLTFQLNNIRTSSNEAILEDITFNGVDMSVGKPSQLDSSSSRYYYGVLIELWAFNESLGDIQYQNRFVHFYLNLALT